MAKRGQVYQWRVKFTYPVDLTIGREKEITATQVQGSRDEARYHAEGIASRGGTAQIIHVDAETKKRIVVETVTPDDVEHDDDDD